MRRAVGLDLGGTNIKRAVVGQAVDGTLDVKETDSTPTPRVGGPNEVCARLVGFGSEALTGDDPTTVGVALPGIFTDEGDGVLFPNLPGHWPEYPIAQTLAAGFGSPVRLINDGRAFALAEATAGAAAGADTAVCIALGTGVGGGVYVGGRIQEGRWGIAGEVGHQTVEPNGPLCDCGNHGCAEIVAKASEVARLGGRATAAEVYAGAAASDPRCLAAVERVAGYLGIAIANLVTVLGPERVVIGGGIAAAGDVLLDPLRRSVAARAPLVPAGEIDIVPALLGSAAGAIGAAVAALNDLP